MQASDDTARKRSAGKPIRKAQMPRPFTDGGHRCTRKSHRNRCQIIIVGQMMARLKGEIVHRAEHAPIRRPTEAGRLHGGDLAADALLRDVEPLEEGPQRRVEIGYQTRAELARRGKHREQTALTCRDGKFGASQGHEMNIPVPEGPGRCGGFRELLRQLEPRPHALRTAQRQHGTTCPDADRQDGA
jgi:hypothetical protein